MNKRLARELRRLGRRDQARRLTFKPGDSWDDSVDRKNTKVLKRIVRKYGWPTIGRVGKAASRAAWLIAQHAVFDKKFQMSILKKIEGLYKQNSANIAPYQIAYLTDRILIEKRKSQIFGTQFSITKSGRVRGLPTRDKTHINERRKVYGLEPIAQYLKSALKDSKHFTKSTQ